MVFSSFIHYKGKKTVHKTENKRDKITRELAFQKGQIAARAKKLKVSLAKVGGEDDGEVNDIPNWRRDAGASDED